MRKRRNILLSAIAGILLLTLSISIVQICKIYREYAEESRQHQKFLVYKPNGQTLSESSLQPIDPENAVANQSVIDLLERYPDPVGCLTIDSTKIDYPFVQSKDNQTYRYHDIDFNYLISGTVFMDYRNSPDFTDFSTILYDTK